MRTKEETNKLIETIAARAWPAKRTKKYGKWLLRTHDGVTKRANSVLTLGEIPKDKDWLLHIEQYYHSQGLTPYFYITESSPIGLKTVLENQHYKLDTKLGILSVSPEQIINKVSLHKEWDLTIEPAVSAAWMTAFMSLEGHKSQETKAFTEIFRAIPLVKGFIALKMREEIIAVATIATEDGWGYISNVIVSPKYRRRGIASQLMLHLALWAKKHGTENLFMQVLANNEPALRLYDTLGFVTIAKSYYVKKISNSLHKV